MCFHCSFEALHQARELWKTKQLKLEEKFANSSKYTCLWSHLNKKSGETYQFICWRLFHSTHILKHWKLKHVLGATAINNIKLFMWFVDLNAILIIYAVWIVGSVRTVRKLGTMGTTRTAETLWETRTWRKIAFTGLLDRKTVEWFVTWHPIHLTSTGHHL